MQAVTIEEARKATRQLWASVKTAAQFAGFTPDDTGVSRLRFFLRKWNKTHPDNRVMQRHGYVEVISLGRALEVSAEEHRGRARGKR